VRSPAWMAAYAVTLVLLGAAYATLVFSSPRAALTFALAALVTVVVSLVLTLRR
jgi:hypothetical protein